MPLPRPVRTYKDQIIRKKLALSDDTSRDNFITPGQLAFAEWLSYQDKPPVTEQLEKYAELNQRTVTAGFLRKLKQRPAFQEFFVKLSLDHLARARAKILEKYPEYADMHFRNATAADKEGDYNAVVKYTTPMLDRIVPKTERAVVATQVTVVLSDSRREALDEETIEVSAVEVIEVEELDP